MNLGITDAIALADALAEVLLRGGSATALDTYATAQRRRAEQVLKLTGRLAARVPAVRRQLAVQLSGLGRR
jgi:2-polyprenyl-6-methoxyphenol hydroxylase-like FAD-dependent oxidoreductase